MTAISAITTVATTPADSPDFRHWISSSKSSLERALAIGGAGVKFAVPAANEGYGIRGFIAPLHFADSAVRLASEAVSLLERTSTNGVYQPFVQGALASTRQGILELQAFQDRVNGYQYGPIAQPSDMVSYMRGIESLYSARTWLGSDVQPGIGLSDSSAQAG